MHVEAMRPVSLPGFPSAPPHLSSPGGAVSSWLTTPQGIVNIVAPGVVVDERLARFISQDGQEALYARFGQGKQYIFVHDFSHAAGYTSEARRTLTDWGARTISQVAAVHVIPPSNHAVFRMGVSAAAAALRVAGMHVEIAPSLADVIKRHGLRIAR